MQYTATGKELAEAFKAAKYYFDQPEKIKVAGSKRNFYTIGAAMRFAIGHNRRVLYCAIGLMMQRLEYLPASEWLIKNGVPEQEVKGVTGMKNVKVWKSLWLEKLYEEFKDSNEDITSEYPF